MKNLEVYKSIVAGHAAAIIRYSQDKKPLQACQAAITRMCVNLTFEDAQFVAQGLYSELRIFLDIPDGLSVPMTLNNFDRQSVLEALEAIATPHIY